MRPPQWQSLATLATSPQPAAADDCPNGGTVRFGVEPYDTAARLVPIYEKIGKMISDKIGCKVEVYRRDRLQRRDRSDAQRQARNRRIRAARLRAGAPGGEGRGGGRVRRRGRQAGHLLGEHRDLSVVRHQNDRGHSRALLRVLRCGLNVRSPVSGLWAAQGRGSIRTRTSRRSTPAATRLRSRPSTTTRSMPAS